MPDKMAEMWSQLGRESDLHSVRLEEMMVPIASGQELRKPKKLFEHVEV